MICSPHPMLMRVQRWIHNEILTSPGALSKLGPASSAYAPGCSILKNAQRHVSSRWIVKLDIKDFFESISERQVYYVFRDLGYPALLSFEMSRLCTRVIPERSDGVARQRDKKWRWRNNLARDGMPYDHVRSVGHLPQGAPTSGMIANLAFTRQDSEIQDIADKYGAEYSRYADDIVISLNDSNKAECEAIISQVARVVSSAGYRVNRAKSRIHGPGSRKIVTGLVVNDSTPRLPRAYKEDIMLCLYHIKKHGLLSHMVRRCAVSPLGYLNHLVGKILFAFSIEPIFGAGAMAELRGMMTSHQELYSMLDELGLASVKAGNFENLNKIVF